MGPYAAALAALARKIKKEDARKLEKRRGVAESRTPDKPDPTAVFNNTERVCEQPAYNNDEPIREPQAYNNTLAICEPPAYAANYYGLPFLPPPAMINHYSAAGFGPPPSAYATASYYHNRLILISPISPEESDTDRESDSESSDSSDSSDTSNSKAFSTPLKSAAPNYMLEPYDGTPTTSHERKMFRRRLNFHDPHLIYDLEDISEDECDGGETMQKMPMADDDIIVTETMQAWLEALSRMFQARNG